MSPSVLVGIVTYNPDINRLKLNLDSIYRQTQAVVIIDNGSENYKDINHLASVYKNINIIRNEKNRGIAAALNQIGDMANKDNYEAFLTLDQDSIVNKNLVKNLYTVLNASDVGMSCPYINRYNDFEASESFNEVPVAITSGAMVKTEVWRVIGGFWEFLFIDEVDHEFCYQIRLKGFKIIKTNNVAIDHIIGEPFTKNLMGHTFHPTNHSAFRRYYIARNDIIMQHLYPNEIYPFTHRYKMLFKIFVSILCCEKQKTAKIRAILHGIKDAFVWNLYHSEIDNRRE